MFKKFFLFLFSLQLLYATALLGGSVRGNVTNQEGTAINGASVSLSNESHTFRATTQWNGGYQFSRIPAGTYSLSATAWNYQPYTHSEQVVLEETTRVSGLNITMSPAVANASLSGIVTNSASSNPIAGAVIRVSRNHHGGDSGNVATTDANGNYSIENIFPGTYSVFCEAEGYYSNSTWNVSIATGSMLDIQLLERLEGTVSGTVTRDGSGEPVGFAFLEFIPADSSRHWRFNHSVTDSLGNYSAELPVGDYYVSCKIGNGGHHGPQYREFYDNAQTISEATVVTVSDDQTTGNINFGIPSPQEIGIVVSGKVSDYNNVPLAGAKVRVWPFARHMRRDSLFTVTDAEGNYSISISRVTMNNVRFLVSAKMQGYAVEYYQEKTSWHTADVFTVNSDTSFASVDFTLDTATVGSTNSISGIITNAQGAPLQNAFVHGYARHSRRAAHAVTNEEGAYTLENLRNENYILFFSASDYVPEFFDNVQTWEDATPVAASGTVTGINAALDSVQGDSSFGKITGILRNGSNTLVSGVILTVKNSAGSVINTSFTGADGSYSIEGLATGTYTVSATKIDYASATSNAVIDINQSTTVLNMNITPTVLGVGEGMEEIPTETALRGNYPNPFNPTTNITFALRENTTVTLRVYNILGAEISTLLNNEPMDAGVHQVSFIATGFPSGIYFYQLLTTNEAMTKKMVLTK